MARPGHRNDDALWTTPHVTSAAWIEEERSGREVWREESVALDGEEGCAGREMCGRNRTSRSSEAAPRRAASATAVAGTPAAVAPSASAAAATLPLPRAAVALPVYRSPRVVPGLRREPAPDLQIRRWELHRRPRVPRPSSVSAPLGEGLVIGLGTLDLAARTRMRRRSMCAPSESKLCHPALLRHTLCLAAGQCRWVCTLAVMLGGQHWRSCLTSVATQPKMENWSGQRGDPIVSIINTKRCSQLVSAH